MLTLLLASLLAAPPAGDSWSVSIHPAIVVAMEEQGSDLPEAPEGRGAQTPDPPRLARAQALTPRVRTHKPRASRKKRETGSLPPKIRRPIQEFP
jgi:hypothetical protein